MKNVLLNLQLFAWTEGQAGAPTTQPVNVTTQSNMSPTMKTFYDTTLLENARETMVFTQLGDNQPLKGNKIEWRKFNTFPKALTPLTEGVIPTGQTFGMTKIEAETSQHGDYVSVSDRRMVIMCLYLIDSSLSHLMMLSLALQKKWVPQKVKHTILLQETFL